MALIRFYYLQVNYYFNTSMKKTKYLFIGAAFIALLASGFVFGHFVVSFLNHFLMRPGRSLQPHAKTSNREQHLEFGWHIEVANPVYLSNNNTQL